MNVFSGFKIMILNFRAKALPLVISSVLSLTVFPAGRAHGAMNGVTEVSDLLKTSKLSWLEGEQYDPLTGTFSFVHEDMRIEGNGPDLVVVRDTESILIPSLRGFGVEPRTVNSKVSGFLTSQKMKYTSEERKFRCRPSETKASTDNIEIYGIGSEVYQLPVVLSLYGKSISFYSAKNPVVKGVSSFPEDADFVSAENWYLKCSGTGGLGEEVTTGTIWAYSPDGLVYEFDLDVNATI